MDLDVSTLDALRGGGLTDVRVLRLASCGLTAFPLEIFDHAETLEVLDLSGNALTALPDDLGRLTRLQALFCSGNHFPRLPPVLGDCPALSQVGFRGSGVREIPTESLPPRLRWLTLTDNQIEAVPAALGARPFLQKLMLAGNRLAHLPPALAGAPNLELLRLSANRFEALPPWLVELPRLAWLAWAGNPLDRTRETASSAAVRWADLQPGALLGEGASGHVYETLWSPEGGEQLRAALKLFKGTMTSDGLPSSEMAACLAAGPHPNLIGGLGRLSGHPQGVEGLLMPLVPAQWRILAGPPSLASCSRDVYDPDLHLDLDVALRIASGIGGAASHLHARGLTHGDLYAHNVLWDGALGDAVLSDFGAASFMPDGAHGAFARFDVRAWGLLLGELLDLSPGDTPRHLAASALQSACVSPNPAGRPALQEAVQSLGSL